MIGINALRDHRLPFPDDPNKEQLEEIWTMIVKGRSPDFPRVIENFNDMLGRISGSRILENRLAKTLAQSTIQNILRAEDQLRHHFSSYETGRIPTSPPEKKEEILVRFIEHLLNTPNFVDIGPWLTRDPRCLRIPAGMEPMS